MSKQHFNFKSSIRDWYIRAFPSDQLGYRISPLATFAGAVKCMADGGDIYKYLGVGDSLVRENVFSKIASITGVDYDAVYDLWLHHDEDECSRLVFLGDHPDCAVDRDWREQFDEVVSPSEQVRYDELLAAEEHRKAETFDSFMEVNETPMDEVRGAGIAMMLMQGIVFAEIARKIDGPSEELNERIATFNRDLKRIYSEPLHKKVEQIESQVGKLEEKAAIYDEMRYTAEHTDPADIRIADALAPLRERQEQVSGELKRLGFSGNIHGLIVDVNFSHHIMVNPADGSLVFYYSPEYGWVGTFDSFPKLLEHVKDSEQLHIDMNPLYALQAGDTPTRCDVALERYDAGVLAPSPSMALAPASIEGVEVLEKSEGRDLDRLVNVDLEHGAYKLSRDVAPLQRLFSKHVLRDFDARLAELDDGSAARRTKSMAGRVFKDEFGMMWLIVGDDLGEFVDALDQDGKERRVTVLALRKLVATQGDGRWLTKSLDETESAFKGRYQPKAWRGALPSLRLRDLSAGE